MIWPTKKLGEVTEFLDNQRIPLNKEERSKKRGPYPYYGATGVVDWINDYIFDGEFVLLAEDGGPFFERDKTIAYRISGKSWVNNHAHILKATKLIDIDFLGYTLMGIDVKSYLTGSTRAKLTKSQAKRIQIPTPSMQTQKQIVERLDKIVDAQKLNDELIEKTDELFQSLLHKELNPADKNWKVKKLGELFEITSSKRVFESEWTKQGIPFYRAREIVSLAKNQELKNPIFISEKMFERYREKYGVPQKGDILVTGVGTLGISYIVKNEDKFYFKDGNIIWLKKQSNSKADSQFVKFFFESKIFKHQINRMSAGATVRTYTIITAKKTKIPLPDFKTQKQIVEKFSAVQDYKKQLLEQEIKLKELFNSVLHKSMNGEMNK